MSETGECDRVGSLLVVVLLLAGAIGGNVWQYLHWTGQLGAADERYAGAEREFTKQYGRLREELASERAVVGRAEELNRAARGIIEGLKAELESDAGSISEAIGIIRGVRAAVQELEKVYNAGGACGGGT
jgi:hypothetical protein